jgi:hypothetical protein
MRNSPILAAASLIGMTCGRDAGDIRLLAPGCVFL